MYQVLLSEFGLQGWIEDAPRKCRPVDSQPAAWICNMVVANREGILGLFSYAALYLASEWLAYKFFWNDNSTGSTNSLPGQSPLRIATQSTLPLWRVVGALFALWQLLVAFGFTVSRRSANAPFGVWVLLVNILQLTFIFFVMIYFEQCQSNCGTIRLVPTVLGALNRHGLLSFIVANLLTGVVNLSINTLEVGDGSAFVILVLYLFLVGAVALILDRLTSKKID